MRDEPRGVFVDQNQTPELDWLACLAPFVKLRVRLENTKQLIFVGHLLSLENPTPGSVANTLGSLDKHL